MDIMNSDKTKYIFGKSIVSEYWGEHVMTSSVQLFHYIMQMMWSGSYQPVDIYVCHTLFSMNLSRVETNLSVTLSIIKRQYWTLVTQIKWLLTL